MLLKTGFFKLNRVAGTGFIELNLVLECTVVVHSSQSAVSFLKL